MSALDARDTPLFTRNRLHYHPPTLHRKIPDPKPDLKDASGILESLPPNSDLAELISTSYTLFVISLFKAILAKLQASIFKKLGLTEPKITEMEDTLTISKMPEGMEVSEEKPIPDLAPSMKIDSPKHVEPLPETNRILLSDMSIISVPSENHYHHNLYESVFDVESSDDDINTDQYGTNLSFNFNKSIFNNDWTNNTRSASITSSVTAYTYPDDLVLDILKPLNEYDVAVSKFYTPFRPVPKAKYSVTDAVLTSIPLTFLTSFLRKERDSIQELVTKERTSVRAVVSPLAKEQLHIVEQYWRSGRSNQPVVSGFSIDITCKDLLTLSDRSWLNDNVIDFYLSLVTDQNDLVYCWTTHFYTTLKKNGYKGVARWAKRRKINVMEMNKIVVPINSMNTHWAVAVVDNIQLTISYYDSLSSSGNFPAVQTLEQYMMLEADRLGVPPKSYTLQPNMKTPQQQNGYDCGVFTCTVAKHIAQETPLLFSQKDMQTIRRRMAYEIVQKQLLPEVKGPNL